MKYTCPCCGYLVFNEPPGSDDICEICFWHDDLVQLRFVEVRGANKATLIEAQKNLIDFGAAELRVKEFVRKPNASDRKDPNWRPFDFKKDAVEAPISGKDYGKTYPNDRTELYYWRK